MAVLLALVIWFLISDIRAQEPRPWIVLASFRVLAMVCLIALFLPGQIEDLRMDKRFVPLVERDYPGWKHEGFGA